MIKQIDGSYYVAVEAKTVEELAQNITELDRLGCVPVWGRGEDGQANGSPVLVKGDLFVALFLNPAKAQEITAGWRKVSGEAPAALPAVAVVDEGDVHLPVVRKLSSVEQCQYV